MKESSIHAKRICRRDFLKLLAYAGLLAGCERILPAGDATTSSEATLALVGGTLIDGTGANPLPETTVLIQDEHIMAVGQALDVPTDVKTIDVHGATVLPGFINAHVHHSYDKSTLQAWAQDGVTTVRDMGNAESQRKLFAFRDKARTDPQCARLVAVGPIVTVPGGYPIAPWGGDGLTVTSVEDACKKVEQLLNNGADMVKIALESGTLFNQRIPTLSREEASAIVEVVHERGVKVTTHVTAKQELEIALNIGVDDLAHMVLTYMPDSLIERVIEADVYWVPTLELWKSVSEDYSTSFDTTAVSNLRRFVDAGGKVALGTDYGGYTTRVGLGMPMTEIKMMQDAGMTPMQIIVAATKHAAHVCGLESEIGTLEVDKIADILIVNGDPLIDIRALIDTRLVLRSGVVIRQ